MRDEMNRDNTDPALRQACDRWEVLASEFDQLATTGFPDDSRQHNDNAAAADGANSLAVSRYLQERAWNAARILRALHRQVFETEPRSFHLDATVMYPLMRAAIEDAATINWLQKPAEREDRLTRAFRVLFTESSYFEANHVILADAADNVGAKTPDAGVALKTHMSLEQAKVRNVCEQLARDLGLDLNGVTRTVTTREPVRDVFGASSAEFLTWKFLSDLSHFSFMMLRYLAESKVPDTEVPLLHAAMLFFTLTMNQVCDDAITALGRAAAVED